MLERQIIEIGVGIHAALARYEANAGVWPAKKIELARLHNDEFGEALFPIYEAEHLDMIESVSLTIVRGLADLSRLFGVRFISIGCQDFICFEGIRHGHSPVAWEIARRIDRHGLRDRSNIYGQRSLASGCGNSAQTQINLKRIMPTGRWGSGYAVRDEDFGVYDLREGISRVSDPITLQQMRRKGSEETFDGGDLLLYLANAGLHHPSYRWVSTGYYDGHAEKIS